MCLFYCYTFTYRPLLYFDSSQVIKMPIKWKQATPFIVSFMISGKKWNLFERTKNHNESVLSFEFSPSCVELFPLRVIYWSGLELSSLHIHLLILFRIVSLTYSFIDLVWSCSPYIVVYWSGVELSPLHIHLLTLKSHCLRKKSAWL